MYFLLNFTTEEDFEYFNYELHSWLYIDPFTIIAKGKIQLIREFYRRFNCMTKKDRRKLWKICRERYITTQNELHMPITL